jgi:hypothetical protein
MEKRKFWPLDFDPEGEIYENLAWDLPGYQRRPRKISQRQKLARKAG